MAKDPPGYRPYSWAEEQDYMERPRMRTETDVDYKTRQCVAALSAQIISSLRSVVHKWDY